MYLSEKMEALRAENEAHLSVRREKMEGHSGLIPG